MLLTIRFSSFWLERHLKLFLSGWVQSCDCGSPSSFTSYLSSTVAKITSFTAVPVCRICRQTNVMWMELIQFERCAPTGTQRSPQLPHKHLTLADPTVQMLQGSSGWISLIPSSASQPYCLYCFLTIGPLWELCVWEALLRPRIIKLGGQQWWQRCMLWASATMMNVYHRCHFSLRPWQNKHVTFHTEVLSQWNL